MLKKIFILLLFSCPAYYSMAAPTAFKPDTLLNILQVKERNSREQQLVSYLKNYFQESPVNDLGASKAAINEILSKYNVDAREALGYLMESLCQTRLSNAEASENAMIKAIQSAEKSKDDYLSCTFFNYLAYKQTEEGDVIGAVSSYRMAKKDAIKLDDTNLQMIIDINISDVYYKNNFYGLSLFYLNQALAIGNKYWPDDQRRKNIIYYNKSENFFRMNKPDSLALYNEKLKKSKANTYKLYTYKNRTDYYLLMLHHDYKKAIKRIRAMQNDGGYIFEEEDMQNLSDAFYKNGQLDSAKLIVNRLLSNPAEVNHPEIKYHLYEVLGKIAEKQKNYKTAAYDFEMAFQKSEDNINRLTQVGNISSQMKIDELEGSFYKKDEAFKRERLLLMLMVIIALFAIVIVTMFYRNVRQKRHYEKLLYDTKKKELAFINSHDVRKHLTNILGLIEVIRHGESREKEFKEAEEHLFNSARELDKSIKNISEKLDD